MKMGRKSCIFIAGGEPGFMKALSILILKSNRQIELCFQRLRNMWSLLSRLTSYIHPPHRGAMNLAVGFNPLSLPKLLREIRSLLRRVATKTAHISRNSLGNDKVSTHGMVGEYSPVADATGEHPRYLATGRDSVVADATVKTFHPHRGLTPSAKFMGPLTRRGGTSKWIKPS
jgi:hypothetical protein